LYRYFTIAIKVLRPQEVGDFEALNCLLAMNLILSIKPH